MAKKLIASFDETSIPVTSIPVEPVLDDTIAVPRDPANPAHALQGALAAHFMRPVIPGNQASPSTALPDQLDAAASRLSRLAGIVAIPIVLATVLYLLY